MKAAKIFGLILIFSAFAVGWVVGKNRSAVAVPTFTVGSAGASYESGFSAGDSKLTRSGNSKSVAGPPMTDVVLVVNDGESIQAAVQSAEPGTTIQIMPGTYNETVYIDKDGIRLIGVIKEGNRAVLDGEGKLNDAILYSGNNIVVENFTITR